MISPFAPSDQNQATQPQNMQQLLAAALMQPQQVDQHGGYSPLQGIDKMLNGYLAGKYLGQQQTPDQNNPISQALGLGASQGSVGPTNYNAALMGGVPQGMQQFFQSSQPGDALGSGLFGLDQ